MSFLYPSFLYALALVAIPVIIHFFNFRRFKTQEFTQVKFLEQATKVRRKFKRIKDLIIMLLRMLAIACLVLAFAHPIPKEVDSSSQKQNLISVYIDNSFSMGLEGANGDLISEAKLKAEEITDAFGEDALFQLITNDVANRSRDFVEKDLFLQTLEEVSLSPQSLKDDELSKMQRADLLSNTGNRMAVWITDFQKKDFGLENFIGDTSIRQFWIPMISENAANISVDSAWFEQALFVKGQTARLKLQLTNNSDEEIEDRPVSAKVNGAQRAIQTVSLLPKESKTIEMFYLIDTDGWNEIAVLVEDYPIVFDNEIYTTYYVAKGNNVLSLFGEKPNPFVKLVYGKDENFNFNQININQLSVNKLAGYDLVILEGLSEIASGTLESLIDFADNGGNLLFFPTNNINVSSYASLFNRLGMNFSELVNENSGIRDLDLNNGFFADIFDEIPKNTDYPKVFKYYKSNVNTKSKSSSLIRLANGSNLMYLSDLGQGRVFTFTASLKEESSTLVKNGIFLPFMYKFASYKGSQTSNTFFIDQKPTTIRVGPDALGKVIGLYQNEFSFVPNYIYKNGLLTIFEDEIEKSGFYGVKEIEGGDTVYCKLGLNYNRRESNLSFWAKEELENTGKELGVELINSASASVTSAFKDLNDKNRFWRYLLMAAFCFILFEIIAIKLPFK